MVSITNFIIESPSWAKYMVWLAAVALDTGLEGATGGIFSVTQGISWLVNQIVGFFVPGFSLPITATELLFFSLALGVLMAVIWLAGSRK